MFFRHSVFFAKSILAFTHEPSNSYIFITNLTIRMICLFTDWLIRLIRNFVSLFWFFFFSFFLRFLYFSFYITYSILNNILHKSDLRKKKHIFDKVLVLFSNFIDYLNFFPLLIDLLKINFSPNPI